MKKSVKIAAVLTLALLLTGCGSKLAACFDPEKVAEVSDEIFYMAIERDYEGLEAAAAEDVKENLSAEVFAGVLDEQLDARGAFESIDGKATVGYERDGLQYAVTQYRAVFEEGQLSITVYLREDYTLGGFYVKW